MRAMSRRAGLPESRPPRHSPPRAEVRTDATGGRAYRQTARLDIERLRVRTKVWLESRGRFVIGEGGLHLLLGIARRGSLAAAARRIGWSYRHAWGYLRQAETVLGLALTTPSPGKGAARGTRLTPDGQLLLDALLRVRRRMDSAVGESGLTLREIARRGRGGARPGG